MNVDAPAVPCRVIMADGACHWYLLWESTTGEWHFGVRIDGIDVYTVLPVPASEAERLLARAQAQQKKGRDRDDAESARCR